MKFALKWFRDNVTSIRLRQANRVERSTVYVARVRSSQSFLRHIPGRYLMCGGKASTQDLMKAHQSSTEDSLRLWLACFGMSQVVYDICRVELAVVPTGETFRLAEELRDGVG